MTDRPDTSRDQLARVGERLHDARVRWAMYALIALAAIGETSHAFRIGLAVAVLLVAAVVPWLGVTMGEPGSGRPDGAWMLFMGLLCVAVVVAVAVLVARPAPDAASASDGGMTSLGPLWTIGAFGIMYGSWGLHALTNAGARIKNDTPMGVEHA